MLLYCYPYYVVSYRFFKKNVKFFHTMCVVSIALHFLQKPPYIKKRSLTLILQMTERAYLQDF